MPEVKEYTPGTFSWVELVTSDANAAKKFYNGLFGWDPKDQPTGPDMVYTMLQIKGKDLGALYQMNEEQKSQGVHPHWGSYVAVTSADDTAQKVKELGGTVIMEPFDVFTAGRMAIFQDPTGAFFCVWQAREHCGATIVNEPGAFCWNELATKDTSRAIEFYTKLFGWRANVQDVQYTIFMNGENMAGGMLKMKPEWGDVPPNWMVYFAVDDCDASAEKAKDLGGQILNPPTDIPEVGRFSMLQDPQGAAFSIIKLSSLAH